MLEKALALEKEGCYLVLHKADLAYAYAAAGRKNDARNLLVLLEKQEASGRDLGLYPIYFALGEKDRGLLWMENAVKRKSESLI